MQRHINSLEREVILLELQNSGCCYEEEDYEKEASKIYASRKGLK